VSNTWLTLYHEWLTVKHMFDPACRWHWRARPAEPGGHPAGRERARTHLCGILEL